MYRACITSITCCASLLPEVERQRKRERERKKERRREKERGRERERERGRGRAGGREGEREPHDVGEWKENFRMRCF